MEDGIVRKSVLLVVCLLILAVVASAFFIIKFRSRSPKYEVSQQSSVTPPYSAEVEAVLSKKLKLVGELTKSPQIIESVKESNTKNSGITASEIAALDIKWSESDINSSLVKEYLTNSAAKVLIKFQEDNSGFPEIFVTDVKGINVGQTNKTSDLYQADEDWWVKAYSNGAGLAYHGEFEFDESSQTESIALYAPVRDSEGKVIGVIKAVMDLTQIQREL